MNNFDLFDLEFNKNYIPIQKVLNDIKNRFKRISTNVNDGLKQDIYKINEETTLKHLYSDTFNQIEFTKNGYACCFENYPSFIIEDFNGNYCCKYQQILDGTSKLHRIDNPATILISNYYKILMYYINGKKHRLDGPALMEKKLINNNEYLFIYYTNDKINRDNDEPARIFIDEEQKIESWYKNGEMHRDNKPAFIKYNNHKIVEQIYYQNDQIHRLDGPAIINQHYKRYSLFDNCMTVFEYKKFLFRLRYVNISNKWLNNTLLNNKQLLEIAEYNNFKKAKKYLLALTILDELK